MNERNKPKKTLEEEIAESIAIGRRTRETQKRNY